MQPRRDQLYRDESHDPTKPTRKLSDPTVCPDCSATYVAGRWTWQRGPADADRRRCSACQRALDDYPAGFVTLGGSFAQANRAELLRIARNTEAAEKNDHPINRIMKISEGDDATEITTTEVHLAQAIGKSIERAYQGTLEINFSEDIVRVHWHRES